jgi:hypothetical protein
LARSQAFFLTRAARKHSKPERTIDWSLARASTAGTRPSSYKGPIRPQRLRVELMDMIVHQRHTHHSLPTRPTTYACQSTLPLTHRQRNGGHAGVQRRVRCQQPWGARHHARHHARRGRRRRCSQSAHQLRRGAPLPAAGSGGEVCQPRLLHGRRHPREQRPGG